MIQALTVKAKGCFGESKESESLRSGGEVVWWRTSINIDDRKGTAKMVERKNTIVCIFEQASPRISAMDVHQWISKAL